MDLGVEEGARVPSLERKAWGNLPEVGAERDAPVWLCRRGAWYSLVDEAWKRGNSI